MNEEFDRSARRGLALIAAAIAALVVFTLRALLFSRAHVLPGTDASNLYAWELYTRAVLAAGRLPHWNPYLFSGTPHLADTETTVFYPPALALRWIPPVEFFSWMTAVHMWIAGVGTAFLARTVRLGWMSAAAAGIAVTLGGSIPAWIFNGHLLLLYGTAWLPWILAMTIVSARRATAWPHPGLVVLLVVQFLAGYLQGSIYVAAATALCAAWLVALPPVDRRGLARLLPLAQVGAAALLAAGLAAFQLLPTLQLIGEAGRTAGMPYSTAARGGWSVHDLGTFLFPFEGRLTLRNMGDHTAYVGWLLAAAAPLGFFFSGVHRRAAIVFGLLTVVSIAFVMADSLPVYRLHFLLFPGLRIPGRLLFVTTVSVAMLGAIGIDSLVKLAAARSTAVAFAVSTLALALVTVDLVGYSRGAVQPTSPEPAPTTLRIPSGAGRTLSLCDRALGAMDLAIAARPAVDGAGGMFLRDYASFEAVAQAEGPLRMRRDLLDLANVTTLVSCVSVDADGFHEVARSDIAIVYRNDAAWPRALWTCGADQMTGREAIEHLRQVHYTEDRRLDRRHFVNVRWSVSDDAARSALEARYHLADGVRVEGRTWRYDLQDRSAANVQKLLSDPRVEDTHGIDRSTGGVTVAGGAQLLFGTHSCDRMGAVTDVVSDHPGGDVSMVTDAPTDGLVFLSEPYYPERRAFVDGTAVTALKADVAFMAVPVPAGRHEVAVRYIPRRFQAGLVVSAATLFGWIAAATFLAPRIARRHSSATAVST